MDVSNLPEHERIDLFNQWVNRESNPNEFDFGNDMTFTLDQLSDPNYIIPEWGCNIPSRLRELGSKIGSRCIITIGYTPSYTGVLKGVGADYTDFYYIVTKDDGSTVYESAVSGIEF